MKRRQFIGLTGGLAVSWPIVAVTQQRTSGGGSGVWSPLPISGGGYCTGMDVAPDGTMVVRVDVYNAYIGGTTPRTKWRPLFTAANLSSSVWFNNNYADGGGLGVYEIKLAPSNSNRIYAMLAGYFFVSSDKGATWSTNFNPVYMGNEANSGSWRIVQQKMAVDPANPDVCYAGTPSNGLYRTLNGGISWTSVAAIPIPVVSTRPGIAGICFDPSGGTTSNEGVTVTSIIYAASHANGVYRTTDGGATWALLRESPRYIESAIVSGGKYYACGAFTALPSAVADTAFSFSGTTWTTLVSEPQRLHCISVNPNNSSMIVVLSPNGWPRVSTNGGRSFSTINWVAPIYSSSDSPWLATKIQNGSATYLSLGGMAYDPIVADRIWVSNGSTICYTDSITAYYNGSTVITWNDQTTGIHNLVGTEVISPPGAGRVPLISVLDCQFFRIDNTNAEPSVFGITRHPYQEAGTCIDFAKQNPDTIVALIGWENSISGYSKDGGQTWSQFANKPFAASAGICVAASTDTNFAAIGWGATSIAYTLDRGATPWRMAVGLPEIGWPTAGYVSIPAPIKPLAADYVTPNKFYLFNGNNGLYVSNDGGATWVRVNTASAASKFGGVYYLTQLRTVPANAGHLFLCAGRLAGQPFPTKDQLYFSNDGGVTLTPVPNVKSCWCVGTGAVVAGHSYPTIWIVGWVKISTTQYKYGIWVCKDFNPATATGNWVFLIDQPYGNFDLIVSLTGDHNDPTKCYWATVGSTGGFGKDLRY
jgi:hypothetical protein